jgi:hypothetical protein
MLSVAPSGSAPKPRLAMPAVNNSATVCQLVFRPIAVPSREGVEVTEGETLQRKQDTTQHIIHSILF